MSAAVVCDQHDESALATRTSGVGALGSNFSAAEFRRQTYRSAPTLLSLIAPRSTSVPWSA